MYEVVNVAASPLPNLYVHAVAIPLNAFEGTGGGHRSTRPQLHLLHVDLVREIPEAKKPRQIAIGAGNGKAKVVEQKAAA